MLRLPETSPPPPAAILPTAASEHNDVESDENPNPLKQTPKPILIFPSWTRRTPVAPLQFGAVCFIAPPCFGTAFRWENTANMNVKRTCSVALSASVSHQSRTLSFSDRVAYQRPIESVSWHHRIWPDRPDPKPSLDAVMSQAQLEEKVTSYLRNSQTLDDCQRRIYG